MQWFSQNWVWVLFFAGFIAMHLFGHGGHGGHGGRGGHDDSQKSPVPAGNDNVQRDLKQGSGHHH